MKIAVYSIARNEAHEVEGWEVATRDADYRLLFDTGSTDDTIERMRAASDSVEIVQGFIRPWRYDDARNAALALIPADVDICIALDMDERLCGPTGIVGEGWREPVIQCWTEGTRMLRCPIVNPGGVSWWSWRIHSRIGWRWRSPIHELLHWRTGPFKEVFTEDFRIEHHPRTEKTRPVHLDMLEEAVEESPTDSRVVLQYGWQLLVDGHTEKGLTELQRALDLGSNTGLDAAFIHRMLAQHDRKEHLLAHIADAEKAALTTSNQILLAAHYLNLGEWQQCYMAAQAGIARERMWPQSVGHWGDDARIKTSWLHDTAAIAAFNTWDFEAALGHAVSAFERNGDQAHYDQVKRIEQKIGEGATRENLPPKPTSISVEVRRAAEQDNATASDDVADMDEDTLSAVKAAE